ncbi:GntR family transcriptional regulator [Litchfieldia salsa]|uniref:Transcriptional regulator, GntR family n=1 Tax=Litchfieldia salsa TaxID=930152 RepID=A0A1H0X220_9BACI|nr:GntR family transcriptional regulator [Litchfieldia salsa]SDP96991.1 transcriptional regulator, GntR family [Litchfieldia salsa]
MKERSTPKYLLLKQEILSWIQSNKLSVNEKIPTENELANQFQLSRHTVRQTLGELEKEGWLYKIQGKGSFVSKREIFKGNDLKMIGILTTYISDYIFPHIVRGAEETLRSKGYRLQLSSTDNDKVKEKENLEMLIEQPLTGLIIEPTKSAQGNPNLEYYLSLHNNNIPYLMINERYPELSCPCIKVDDELGGFMAAEHLINLGHKRIMGFFKTDDIQGVNRLKGFMRAHQNYQVNLIASDVVSYVTEEKNNKPTNKALEALKEKEDRPTAFVCYNDELAIKLLEVLRQEGLTIPSDLSIVSFDDSLLATATEVKFTTLSHPKAEIGKKAAEILLSMIENPSSKPSDIVFSPELIIRDSTKKL